MAKFWQTIGSGSRAEKEVIDIVRRYTQYVYSNVRIPTLYTESAETELDIIAAIDNFILVIEVKNVRRIEGDPLSSYWKMFGEEYGDGYSNINVLTQNRLHVKAFKDAWRVSGRKTPPVLSVVVTPNDCEIPQSLRDFGVITVGELSLQLSELVTEEKYVAVPKFGYALDFIIDSETNRIARKDFV